jgi:two-component system chemotaxis response regulator CheY
MKILIVDDEFVSRTKLKLIMENYGQCEAVEHGKDAIAIFHHAHFINEPFNLIMLDINLPEMNGIMVLSGKDFDGHILWGQRPYCCKRTIRL